VNKKNVDRQKHKKLSLVHNPVNLDCMSAHVIIICDNAQLYSTEI